MYMCMYVSQSVNTVNNNKCVIIIFYSVKYTVLDMRDLVNTVACFVFWLQISNIKMF